MRAKFAASYPMEPALEGFMMLDASALLGLTVAYWDIWLPLAAGMVAGLVSVIAVRSFCGRRPEPAAEPPPTQGPTSTADPFIDGSPMEQRRALRRAGHPIRVVLKAPHDKDPSWDAWVLERSIGGLGLLVESEFPQGTILKVFPVSVSQSAPWVDIEVKSCRPGEDGYELGCQFVKTPPWSVLLLFG
jgi:hypothetical protein